MAFKELRIKVSAEQKKESVTLASDGRLLVSVRDKREDGKANLRALMLESEYINVPSTHVTILRGHNLPTKTLRIRTAM